MNERIKKALDEIKRGIDCGESIALARKKACGTPTAKFEIQVMHTEEYVQILNDYMEKIRKPIRYKLVGMRLERLNVPKE